MPGKPTTVAQYLAALPEDRRKALGAVRKVILDNLDDGYEEGLQYGMIGYYVPHSIYPPGYHCDRAQPLPYLSLASQKNHMAIYLFCIYGSEPEQRWFRQTWAGSGKKLDMGKSCVRFKKIDDLALDVVAGMLKRTPVSKFVASYESALGQLGGGAAKPARRRTGAAAKKAATKAAGKKTKKKVARKKTARKVARKTGAKATARTAGKKGSKTRTARRTSGKSARRATGKPAARRRAR